MASETKSELVEELSSQSTKADLVELLGRRLKKDEISKLLDDDSDGTKDELLHKLGSRTKDELVQAVESRLTKDEIEKAVDAVREDSEDEDEDDSRKAENASSKQQRNDRQQTDDEKRDQKRDEQQRSRNLDGTELDWNAELEWSPAPRPTPAPVAFAGAPPFLPGARVRVDLAGLPLLGVFLGKGASAAGTIVGVNAHDRVVCVHLDACFEGAKQIVLPPERVILDR